MSGWLIGVCGVLLCAAMLAVLLRGWRPELALCLSLGAGVLVLLMLLRRIEPLLATVNGLLVEGAFPTPYLTAVLKGAGICTVTQLTADTCRDAGETALASKAEMAGRLLLLAVAVPLFGEVLSLVTALIGRVSG